MAVASPGVRERLPERRAGHPLAVPGGGARLQLICYRREIRSGQGRLLIQGEMVRGPEPDRRRRTAPRDTAEGGDHVQARPLERFIYSSAGQLTTAPAAAC